MAGPQQGQHEVSEVGDGDDIDLQHSTPLLTALSCDLTGRRGTHPGAVDENIETVQLRHGRRSGLLVSQIDDEGGGVRQFRDHLLDGLAVASSHDDVVVSPQLLGDRPSDAARRPGHEDFLGVLVVV